MPYSHSHTTSCSVLPDPAPPAETKTCPGCQQAVMDENGRLLSRSGEPFPSLSSSAISQSRPRTLPIVLPSQSFFHVDCFKCAKCHDRVTTDTNLLLLSDGQPVYSNCSYNCSVCHQPILDNAIMTSDDSCLAHCFKCRSCHNRIDELMFAKTSHRIYCMKCHNQCVARSRCHAQKQKERENAALAEAASNSHGVPTKQPPVQHAVCCSCLLTSSASSAHIYLLEFTHFPFQTMRAVYIHASITTP
jgi:Rho-type GTPase-activating protein 1/2